MKTVKTFYKASKANFLACEAPDPSIWEPDYISRDRNGRVSSMYWYTSTGVYRLSNHWSAIYGKDKQLLIECGFVATCWWTLTTNKNHMKWQCGFCEWAKFRNVN